MPTQRYSVNQPPIDTLFTWIRLGEIAIPEIQRPFVWEAVQVRDLLDSLLSGFPVGYLIAWKNPDVKLKDGTSSGGKRILIDGQQRVTALMAALLGQEVINKDYKKLRIKIAFHPIDRKFEVLNSAIAKNAAWIPDIAVVFDPNTKIFQLAEAYCSRNPEISKDQIFESLELLRGITSNQIGLIELAPDLDINTVTQIFIRVNSQGVPLSQADFAMSKIAVNDTFEGHTLRKAIDYFCHLARNPEFFTTMKNDTEFAASEFFPAMTWLKDEADDIYDPSYIDMLRVAFAAGFQRGKMEDLVALLSGRNFESRQFEAAIVESSFATLKSGVRRFINENHFKSFLMIIRSAGFIDPSMIRSQNTLNFAYILYLLLKEQGPKPGEIERHVRRWFVMATLTVRYSTAAESQFDYDIRQIKAQGIDAYAAATIAGTLSDSFWQTSLPQEFDTSSVSSPYFQAFKAAQVKANDLGFLSKDITVRDLVLLKSDVHHVFPKSLLAKRGLGKSQYNQVANYVIAQSEINLAIGNKEPLVYFQQLIEQCNGGKLRYGNICDEEELRRNLEMHCMPDGIETMTLDDYPTYLVERRQLMARKVRKYFEAL